MLAFVTGVIKISEMYCASQTQLCSAEPCRHLYYSLLSVFQRASSRWPFIESRFLSFLCLDGSQLLPEKPLNYKGLTQPEKLIPRKFENDLLLPST